MRLLLSLSISILVASTALAQDCLLDKKPVQNLVQDYAEVLSDQQERQLRGALEAFNKKTSTQILIVTVKDLCGFDKSEFTYTLGQKWGVGQKGKDNGIVVMVKPHGQQGNRHAFIATGYGMEGVLPDAIAHRIVNNEMIPEFKQGRFYEGIAKAANELMAITGGEYTAEAYDERTKGNAQAPWLTLVVILVFLGISFIGKAGQARRYSATNGVGFWAAWMLLQQSRRSHGGSYSNFRSGGGSFGGFGGGGFGGGGAGGSW